MERKNNVFGSENGSSSDLQPPTFGQRLRERAVQFARDFQGVALRSSFYILETAAVYTGMRLSGASQTVAVEAALGIMVGSMLAGELYAFPRLSRRFPWLRVSFWDRP